MKSEKGLYIEKVDPKNHKSYIQAGVSGLVYDGNKRVGFRKICTFCSNPFTAKQPQVKTCKKECAKAQKGKKVSDSKKGKDPWNKGKKGIYPEETRQKMGVKNQGRSLLDSHKKSISEGLLKYYKNSYSPNKGKKLPESWKKKIKKSSTRAAQKKIKYTKNDVKEFCKKNELELAGFPDKTSIHSLVGLKCKECGGYYKAKIQNLLDFGGYRSCRGCKGVTSSGENEIYEFLSSLGIKGILRNARPSFMEKLELDLYLPDKKLAIEYHGLAYHSERPIFRTKDVSRVKDLHKRKHQLCKKEGIQLIQIFEDEWRGKPEILKSMIKSRLGLSKNKIFARKCEIAIVDDSQNKLFFSQNHITGNVRNRCTFGLYYKNKLVSALSLRKTWNKKYGENTLEIARFATKMNTQVIGGFSKLMKKVIEYVKSEGYNRILTYSDLRFGEGKVYSQYGFKLLGSTNPNYFYEKSGIRENRFKHRKNNDPEFIAEYGDTERVQNMNLGWYPIYDAGNNIFILDVDTKENH